MILIKNRQKKYAVDTEKISRTVQTVLEALGYQDFDIGIWLTTNKTIARYNKAYRHKSGPTDILSFPYHSHIQTDEKNLGDILISLEFVYTHKRWADTQPEERLPILLVHGICHLIGYDHETDKEYAAMHAQEQKLLKLIQP